MKDHKKTLEKELSKVEISNLCDKKFKVIIVKMVTRLQKGVDEHRENFNKEIENTKKNQSKLKKTMTEMKTTLEGISSRLENAIEWISNLEDRVIESTQAEQ